MLIKITITDKNQPSKKPEKYHFSGPNALKDAEKLISKKYRGSPS